MLSTHAPLWNRKRTVRATQWVTERSLPESGVSDPEFIQTLRDVGILEIGLADQARAVQFALSENPAAQRSRFLPRTRARSIQAQVWHSNSEEHSREVSVVVLLDRAFRNFASVFFPLTRPTHPLPSLSRLNTNRQSLSHKKMPYQQRLVEGASQGFVRAHRRARIGNDVLHGNPNA